MKNDKTRETFQVKIFNFSRFFNNLGVLGSFLFFLKRNIYGGSTQGDSNLAWLGLASLEVEWYSVFDRKLVSWDPTRDQAG